MSSLQYNFDNVMDVVRTYGLRRALSNVRDGLPNIDV